MAEAAESDSGQMNLSYEIARPHHLPQIHRLLYQSFHRDEPMTHHLKLHQVIRSVVRWPSDKR